MVQAFALQSGGCIRIESTPGRGAAVQIILPVSAADETPQQPKLPSTRDKSPAGRGRILLVDDEVELLKIAERWLQHLGYEVATADNAAAALDTLAGGTFDLLLTDIVMPGEMDGLALARCAATRHPELKIVLTSGYPENIGDDDRRRWALVEKPATRASLADAVEVALAGSRQPAI
jgi:CheY-like chemotaxis protein